MTLQQQTTTSRSMRLLTAVVVACSLLAVLAAPANAQPPGPIVEPTTVGFFYGTFGENPNTVMLVGGTAEQFCNANPASPFDGDPGRAVSRTRFGADGSVAISLHSGAQPVHLYGTPIEGAPPWIEAVCRIHFAGGAVPQPFASGLVELKARTTIVSENLIEISNSATGWARGTDGTHYWVAGSADFKVVDGELVGNPADFVDFRLNNLGRHAPL